MIIKRSGRDAGPQPFEGERGANSREQRGGVRQMHTPGRRVVRKDENSEPWELTRPITKTYLGN